MKNFLLPLFLLTCLPVNSADQVFIEGNEYGQGFITQHLNRCFFVAPNHVVKDSLFLNLVGDNSQRSVGEGQVIQAFGYDLAVGSVEGGLSNDCGSLFNALEANTQVIESNNTFAISTVNSDGLKSRQNAIAAETTLTHIYVQPVSEEHNLYKGMSGSLVFSGDIPIGMLQSIDSQTGFGKVLRFDRLLETINPFFIGGSVIANKLQDKEIISVDAIPFKISEWTHTSANSSSSINAIIDGDNKTAWEVLLNGEVFEITLTLDESTEISGLTLLSNYNDKATVKSFEVLISKKSTGRRGWISKSSLSTFPHTIENKMTWLPLKAKRIKIRVFESWEPSSLVHINGLVIH